MSRLASAIVILTTLLAGTAALAGQRTVTLAVEGMTCASCPYIVKRSLARVPGVHDVEVSFERKTAVVTFEDTKADVADMMAATSAFGFSSRLLEPESAQRR